MRTWFPYCASLMIFIWVVNMLGFIPLPLSDEKVDIAGVQRADARDLRGHLDAVGDARARAHDLGVHPRRGDSRERRPAVPAELDPRRAEGAVSADHPARDPRPVHAADQPLGSSLRQHARRAHADPDVHRAHLRAREPRRRRRRSSGRDRVLPVRGRDRRLDPGLSSSLPCLPSTSARPSSRSTKEEHPHVISFLRRALPTATSPTPARRSRSRSASASARSVPASASATSSAR